VAPAATNSAANGTNSKGSAAAASAPLPSFSLVVAATQSGGIGRAGGLPWPNGALAADMARFKALTLGQAEGSAAAATGSEDEKGRLLNTVIMGRKTWESIPAKFRPLPGRINIVLTRQADEWTKEHLSTPKENTYVAASLHDALALVRTLPQASTADGSVFVIGGAALYREGLASPLCHTIHLTRVLREFDVDTHFHIGDGLAGGERSEWIMAHVGDVQVGSAATGAVPFQFQTLERRVKSYELGNAEEQQYLDLVRRVMEQGTLKGDRTGTGTLSLFGAQMRFSLRDGRFPLLTSKRVFWRGVVEELLWLIRGCTDSKALAAKKVHIWDDNGTRAFLDKLGFKEREEGDLGPVSVIPPHFQLLAPASSTLWP
jgi:dihydrofolate reductase/thymidylate synthase